MHIHESVNPQSTGSQLVVNVLTSDKESFSVTTDGLFGGKLVYEEDPAKAGI